MTKPDQPEPYTYTDPDGDQLHITQTHRLGSPAISLRAARPDVPEASAAGQDNPAASLLPAWEAVYEPGNVSDYLIGYTNSEAAAKGAAEAWLRSEMSDPGRLEWAPEPLLAVREYDQWFELVRHDPELGECGTGINVRHRVDASAPLPEYGATS